MFNDNSIIKEVNIINKFICYLIVIISLLLCKEVLFLLFINLFLLLITKQYKKLFITNIINIFISLLAIIFPQILWITKLIILIIYTILLKKVTQAIELRYVLESTLYRFQKKKITYKILYFIYFIKYFKYNIRKLYILKDDYEIKVDFKFIKFLISKSYHKTKYQLTELMEINKLRFYNYTKDRTYIEKITWESWDTSYLISHIIIFLLTCFYGR